MTTDDGSVGLSCTVVHRCHIPAVSPIHSGARTCTPHMYHKGPDVVQVRDRRAEQASLRSLTASQGRGRLGQTFPGKGTELGAVSLRCWAGLITPLSLGLLTH